MDIACLIPSDASGDIFFGLYELTAPIVCRGEQRKHNLLCQNQPILQIPGFNVYTRTIVEVDDRFGDYSECNPDPDSGVFSCTHFHFHDNTRCWFNNSEAPQWVEQFKGVCDPNKCQCDAVEKQSVGHENLASVFGGFTFKNWPQQCLDDFYSVRGYVFGGKPEKTLSNVDEGTCCSACSSQPRSLLGGCGGYTFNEKTRSCNMYGTFSKPYMPAPAHMRSGYNLKGTPYWSPIGNGPAELAVLMNGSWYSTREEGECKGGARPGNRDAHGQCWWRTVKQTSNVNASCVNRNLITSVQNTRPECWEACGPQGKNVSSLCFIKCLFETLVGNKTSEVPPMSREKLINIFESSFDSSNKDFGCPQVPPCPSPCKPPLNVRHKSGIEMAHKTKESSWEMGSTPDDSVVEQKLAPVDTWFQENILSLQRPQWSLF